MEKAQTTIYDRPLGSNPRLVITNFGLSQIKNELKDLVSEDDVDEVKKYLQDIIKENGADEVKIYFINSQDYCVKVIKDNAIIKCFRRGKERANNNGKRSNKNGGRNLNR